MSTMTLVVLVLIAFVWWHFLPDEKPAAPSPRFKSSLGTSSDDVDWRNAVQQHCESPAEVAFLHVMIDEFDLRPDGASLRGNEVKLDMQVKEGRYRVDFLVNDWLVVEIDGAAYHSSEEAKRRDWQRDAYLEELGYSVLRITAKEALFNASLTAKKVETALSVGRKIIEVAPQTSGFVKLGNTLSKLGPALEEFNSNINRMKKVNIALSSCRQVFTTEKTMIESAINLAKRHIEIENYIGSSKERRNEMDDIYSELDEAYDRFDRKQGRTTKLDTKISVAKMSPPRLTGISDVDMSIQASYVNLLRERGKYFQSIKAVLSSDVRLALAVKKMLGELGCPEVWMTLA